MIEAHQIDVVLGGQTILQRVSLFVQSGEIVGLMGPPESGKSVLMKTLAGLVPVSSGKIMMQGARLDLLNAHDLSKMQQRMGMSFQNNALFDDMSVFDNVAFSLRRQKLTEEAIQKRVMQRLTDVQLAKSAHKMPYEISGGMQKRVGIARATVHDPEVGLFDDPTAGLDPLTSAAILDLITQQTKNLNMATVVVSNDLPVLLPICDRVVMMHAGHIVYCGPPNLLTASERPEVVQFATGAVEGPL